MSAFSDYLEGALLDHIFRNTNYTRPANIYVALYTGAPTDAGGGTEVSGGSYARQAVATGASSGWNAPSGGLVDNNAAITFPTATANWGKIVAAALLDASSSGNLLFWAWLSNTRFGATALASSDAFTSPSHTLANDDQVILKAAGGTALPTGVSADTLYYVVGVSGSTFQLATTQGGSAINLTADGAAIVYKLNWKQVNNNDIFKFNAGDLDIVFD